MSCQAPLPAKTWRLAQQYALCWRSASRRVCKSFGCFRASALRFQIDDRLIRQPLAELDLLDVRRNLLIGVLFQSKLGTDKIGELLYVHLHLSL